MVSRGSGLRRAVVSSVTTGSYETRRRKLPGKAAGASAGAPERMRLGVEDDPLEVERLLRSEEQIEVLHRLGEEIARHQVALLFRDDALQDRVGGSRAAVTNDRLEEDAAHLEVTRVPGVAGQVIGRLEDLGPGLVAGARDCHGAVVDDLRLDAVEVPHLEARVLEALRPAQVAAEREHRREEGVERTELRRLAGAGVHVDLAVPEPGRRVVGEM